MSDADVLWRTTHDRNNNETREFEATTETGRKRTGAFWQPEGEVADTLIAFGHGASGDRYQEPIPQLAKRFIGAGYAVVSIDGPVHGLRQVGPGGRQAFGEELRRERMIDDMNADWRFAIELAQSSISSDLSRLAYFGLSMGSIFGIPMLADNQRSLELVVATLGLLGARGLGERTGTRLVEDAAKINCPVFFIMQLEDELFTREGYLELFDALGSHNKRIHANPGLHPQVPAEEMRFAFDFMKNQIEKAS